MNNLNFDKLDITNTSRGSRWISGYTISHVVSYVSDKRKTFLAPWSTCYNSKKFWVRDSCRCLFCQSDCNIQFLQCDITPSQPSVMFNGSSCRGPFHCRPRKSWWAKTWSSYPRYYSDAYRTSIAVNDRPQFLLPLRNDKNAVE